MRRIVLVDDHCLVRQGLRTFLETDDENEVVGEAGDGRSALAIVADTCPDIAIVDLQLPDMNGAELCGRIKSICPDCRVLIVTAFVNADLLGSCLRAGASGYVLKDVDVLDLCAAVRTVDEGGSIFDPSASALIASFLMQPPSQHADPLSPRELEVLRHMATGLTNREIAQTLFITENTVKGHVKEILAKLQKRNRVEAIAEARFRHLL